MVTIEIAGAVPLYTPFRFAAPVSWRIAPGESWAVVGPNGSGKSTLAGILAGRMALREGCVEASDEKGPLDICQAIKIIEFRDIYSLVDCRNVYYQQRWNASEVDQAPLAGEILKDIPVHLPVRFEIQHLLDRRIISLSSGELRKLLIVRTLAESPRILVIDNPYIGLDTASRTELDTLLATLKTAGTQIIILVSDPAEIHEWVDKVLPLKERQLLSPQERPAFLKDQTLIKTLFPKPETKVAAVAPTTPGDYEKVIEMEQVTVRYGTKTILDKIDWQVNKGEKWALAGPNGSGKSTLLSLVCGDNPQAYANRISLFGRRRGSGESIWDIKRRIGYLNPDIHTYYLQDIPVVEVAVSGFFESTGLFARATEGQYTAAREWLKALGGEDLAEKSFVKLSFGQQRLVLLARAMVKSPEVLILDEPLHGLDASLKARATALIDDYCVRHGVTLIYVTHYEAEIPACVTKIKRLS